MDISKVSAKNSDGSFNVIIEISKNDDYPIKYEFDKESGALFVDRFMQTPMFYPCSYGFIPHTLSGDGDPADVLVEAAYPIMKGAVINVRPVGVLIMEDESGIDEKILAVPTSKLDQSYDSIQDIYDLNPILMKRISHFFEHYKNLDKGKWVKVTGWEGLSKATTLLDEAIVRASEIAARSS